LYREIVAPVANVLAGKRHLFIVTAGSLTSIPFGILVTDEPPGEDSDPASLRATHWFADAYALSQLPSIQSLQFLRRFPRSRTASTTPGFAGFGDPALQGPPVSRSGTRSPDVARPSQLFMPGRTRSGSAMVNVTQIRLLNRLPGTAIELENMRLALHAPPDSVFLAQRATEARLRTMDLSGTRILVLATHGLMTGEIGAGEPGLVLTPPQSASENDDGFLTASEVSALRLDADWVILSACNTAAGDGSEGAPGLSGLARAFFYAGARTLLASHWPVWDEVAARLTVRAIRLLQEQPGLSRAAALQQAMQPMIATQHGPIRPRGPHSR
jgi:CHAT domain-containing protein